jgi:hypothetical protein
MKLAEFQMREAFAALDWDAAKKIMADHFGCPDILEIKDIPAYSNGVPDFIIKLRGRSYRWSQRFGFETSVWAWEDCAYICYPSQSQPLLDWKDPS